MIYNNNTYITLLTTNAVAFGVGENKRKSKDGVLTILGYEENETVPQNVLNVAINIMTHQQALELVETKEWKSNIII